MAASELLKHLEEFGEIVKPRQPLAAHTVFKVGGAAEVLVQPRTPAELANVVRRCFERKLPMRVLGGGCNILVRDEGVPGVIVRLNEPAFAQVTVTGQRVHAGSGVTLRALISETARHGLAGLETLVGTVGTVGGALRHNAGDRSGEIGHFVRRVEIMDTSGRTQARERDDLQFSYRTSNLDDPVILAGEFELERDSESAIVKRMRKAWIQRKARQPFSFQAAGRIFKNPRGLSAAALIEQAGLVGTRVGGAVVSDRDANFIIAEPNASVRDILRLIDLVRARVQERFQVELELEISIW
ncbi:MAG: UDP-N-acetylmuramate dehydrogenase [Planctomycetes bacterium]|nr:UDP-N-acetylmuramate dehydrogenase [Planctomycetota bacterium]